MGLGLGLEVGLGLVAGLGQLEVSNPGIELGDSGLGLGLDIDF